MNSRRHLVPAVFLFFALAGLAVLAMGALWARHAFLTRGFVDGLPEPIPYAGVSPGINVNLEQYDDLELAENLAEIENAGFAAIKQPFYYSRQFDWEASDRIMESVAKHDPDIVPLLDGDPENDFSPPADPSAFASWAGAFASRYGEQVDYYIIWDEPNLTSHWGNRPVNPAEYAALLAASARSIRSADPQAVIVAAPLAPTTETGPENLADPLFLQSLYEAGAGPAFDVIAGKPYGFDDPPDDRTVDINALNFSRVILLREVAQKNDDDHKAIWAANWGWNSLPQGWSGAPSIWGQTDEQTQADWSVAALARARQEWPWMGPMFLENWQPAAPEDDPRWGFSVAGRKTAEALSTYELGARVAYPGFHPARADDRAQSYVGHWRFSPDFGADVGESGDRVTLHFWGTDVGLRVRRADYHARFYAEVDGLPANSLPRDERGSALVLNSPDPLEEYIRVELVARDLEPGDHTLSVTAHRGAGQWALNGFSVGYSRADSNYGAVMVGLGLFALMCAGLAVYSARKVSWGRFGRSVSDTYRTFNTRQQLAIAAISAGLVAAAGWLTWGEQAAGAYRRLGDGGQLALTAAAASIFYVAPSFLVYMLALGLLFVLIYLRPAWGLAIVAFSIPFYVKPKPMLGYRFSPVEVFLLVTVAAYTLALLTSRFASSSSYFGLRNVGFKVKSTDLAVLTFVVVATLSLLFTERLDVATNEWRVAIVEPAIFYLLLRVMPLERSEMWTILDAFVMGGVAVAVIGLWQYATGQNLITSEGGLMRLRSVYGSPNNVALYLGRVLPMLVAVALMGQGRRRLAYIIMLVPISLAIMLSFSKGALFLGMPAALLVVVIVWRWTAGGRLWPWLMGAGVAAGLAILLAFQVPALAGRLNPQGTTGFLRLNLWRSSLNMFGDHPILGVGLDNFLYAYRGRYILDGAWREPNLSHPHNIFLDFGTRLGLAGLLAGGWLFWSYWRTAFRLPTSVNSEWRPVAAALLGSLVYILAHGLVDHSFFLVDLAFAFYLLLGTAVWLQQNQNATSRVADDSSE